MILLCLDWALQKGFKICDMTAFENIPEIALELQVITGIPAITGTTHESLKKALSEKVNSLINEDFPALVQLLYRMDIPEQRLRMLLEGKRDENAADIIAEMMIERQLQKIEVRKSFRKENDVSENESW